MTISDIYKRYYVSPNLQEHMLTVASVALCIADHWVGERLDRDRLGKTALVHDLANTVKFNLDKYPEFLGDEVVNISFWKSKQKELIGKYGQNDHVATEKMLKEIGFGGDDIKIVQEKSFGNSIVTEKSTGWILKILLYSDLRVLPIGIGTLEERFKDILERMPKYSSRPDINNLFSACREIEKQIQKNIDIPLRTINSRSIIIDKKSLLQVEV